MKFDADVAVPLGVVTVILPVVAAAGTAAVICVALATVKVAAVPLKATAVAPVKFVPVIVIVVPTTPLAGAKLVIVGVEEVTVKLPAELAVPALVVTEILPEVAPRGNGSRYLAGADHRERCGGAIEFQRRRASECRSGDCYGRSGQSTRWRETRNSWSRRRGRGRSRRHASATACS